MNKRQTRRQNLGKYCTPNRRLVTGYLRSLRFCCGVNINFGDTDKNLGAQLHLTIAIGALYLGNICEEHPLALAVNPFTGRVIKAQHDILRGNNRRLPVRGEQHIVRGQHQRTRFHLRFDRQGYVDRHLVAVEVSVKGRTD